MPRQKKCKSCGKEYTPRRPLDPTCSFDCAVLYGLKIMAQNAEKRDRENRRAHKAAKEKTKTVTEWLDKAQTYVNKYIRLRDANEPCISCGTTNPNIQYAAGHYRSRGAASHLRFNHDNLHKQCNHHCNKQLSGNIANYRPALIKKIGIDRVEALDNDNRVHKWTIDEAKSIIEQHKKLIRDIEKPLGIDNF